MIIRILVNGAERDPGEAVRKAIRNRTKGLDKQILSRATRATNALRNSALKILGGTRGGKSYRRAGSRGYYSASAPGEPPAVRTGMLRQNWNPFTEGGGSSGVGWSFTAGIESGEHYAGYLEQGTSKMAPRPYVDRIKEDAAPEIERIFGEPYT